MSRVPTIPAVFGATTTVATAVPEASEFREVRTTVRALFTPSESHVFSPDSPLYPRGGCLNGAQLELLYRICQQLNCALPAINVTSSSTANAVLEAARAANSPVVLQVSHGGGQFFAGKGCPVGKDQAAALGAAALARHVREVGGAYEIPYALHSDHCAKGLLGWFDGMLENDAKFAALEGNGDALFSSHMLDLSEEPDCENLKVCEEKLAKMTSLSRGGIHLEMEIGITGGEEDGVDNSHLSAGDNKLFTTPEQILNVYKALAPISSNFSIAAAFGNVHGVYKPGNVKLTPSILKEHQNHVVNTTKDKPLLVDPVTGSVLGGDKPCLFVFHGGSGSTEEEIKEAVSYGVVKMNLDTDLQWAYWDGIRTYYEANKDYLQGQIGNPKGDDKPNKSYYDPRVWLRKAEESMKKRVLEAFNQLNSTNVLDKEIVIHVRK